MKIPWGRGLCATKAKSCQVVRELGTASIKVPIKVATTATVVDGLHQARRRSGAYRRGAMTTNFSCLRSALRHRPLPAAPPVFTALFGMMNGCGGGPLPATGCRCGRRGHGQHERHCREHDELHGRGGSAPSPCSVEAWARRYGDAEDQWARALAVDEACNLYVAAHVTSSIDFGGGPLKGTNFHSGDALANWTRRGGPLVSVAREQRRRHRASPRSPWTAREPARDRDLYGHLRPRRRAGGLWRQERRLRGQAGRPGQCPPGCAITRRRTASMASALASRSIRRETSWSSGRSAALPISGPARSWPRARTSSS